MCSLTIEREFYLAVDAPVGKHDVGTLGDGGHKRNVLALWCHTVAAQKKKIWQDSKDL